MPWTTAADPGKVDFVFYKTPFLATASNPNPSNFPSMAAWTVGFQNLAATTVGLSFTELTPTPVCTSARSVRAASAALVRRLFDDFGVAARPLTGFASIVYADDQFARGRSGSVNSRSCVGPSASNTASCDHTAIPTQTSGTGIFNVKK
jgi:hypothetical protein